MTHLHPHPNPPSWFVPIAMGSLAVFFTMAMTGLALGPTSCCCCGIESLPLGFLPAFIALKRDPQLSVGNGFAVAFIACGIGSLLVAVPMTLVPDLNMFRLDPDEFRRVMEESIRDSGQELSQEELDQAVDALVTILPYVPVMRALVLTVLGGVVGLLTMLIFRRQQPPQQPYGAPPPQQYPPPRI